MALNERVRIGHRFLRSVRIDADLGDAAVLEGFVCPRSSADVLMTMARHVAETGQGAFTWTGPYGSGKSSLVVALSALLNGNAGLQKTATKVFGPELTKAIRTALPTGTDGWRVLPVVSRRDDPVAVIGDAVKRAGLVSGQSRGGWTESALIDTLTKAAASRPRAQGGLVLVIDEMGKFLEAAAQDGSDIYVLQQLAEAASRSKGRFLVIGVLHQAFEEYAHRLSHEMRDEWAKIQGRFIDLVVSTAGEEQIDLISRAIENDHCPKRHGALASAVAGFARRERAADAARLAEMLKACWPLHPIVASLLGPISRRRFGQNQRSIFGFLNSSEPHGFQDFLSHAGDAEVYSPDRLWDYLRANLEPSILSSPDGHRWALAAEALERCESIGGDTLHIRLLKTIAVIDLFKERSGLVANSDLLRTCFPDITGKSFEKALSQLDAWSFTIFKKFLDARAIFAGSDFDIDQAVRTALDEIDEIDFKELKSLAGLQPILAKRHYHETGALRWFDVNVVPVSGIVEFAAGLEPENGAIGQFLLAIQSVALKKVLRNDQLSENPVRDLFRRSQAILYRFLVVGTEQGADNKPETILGICDIGRQAGGERGQHFAREESHHAINFPGRLETRNQDFFRQRVRREHVEGSDAVQPPERSLRRSGHRIDLQRGVIRHAIPPSCSRMPLRFGQALRSVRLTPARGPVALGLFQQPFTVGSTAASVWSSDSSDSCTRYTATPSQATY